MVVVDQFYQIIESQTPKINPFWKVSHVVVCIISAVTAFLTAFCFGRVLDNFGYNCVLNADIVFEETTVLNTSSSVHAIDLTKTIWGSERACNFIQFTPLVVMISALVWGTYFAILARGGGGYATDLLSRPWAIVYPCLFFTTIFFICYVISTTSLKDGLIYFCDQFQPIFNNTGCVYQINEYAHQFHEDDRNKIPFYSFYANMYVAMISADVGIWSWVCQLILCVLRVLCMADFDLQLVTIMTKDDEFVEKVTELSGDDEVSQV